MQREIPGFGSSGGGGDLRQDQENFSGLERPAQAPEGVQGVFAGKFLDEEWSGAFGVECEQGQQWRNPGGAKGGPGIFQIRKQERGGQEMGWGQELDVDRPPGGPLGATAAVRIGRVRGAGVEGEIVAEDFRGFGTSGQVQSEWQAGAEGGRQDFRAGSEFGGKVLDAAFREGAELLEGPGVMRLGGLENGVEEESQFGREVLMPGAGEGVGNVGSW